LEVDPSYCDDGCTLFRMKPKHDSLLALWSEWYGLYDYADHLGGIHGRNEKYGSKWRKHLDTQQYSRTSRVIRAIEQLSNERGIVGTELESVRPVLQGELDIVFRLQCKQSVAKMVKACQEKGLLPKAKPRGRQSSPQ